MIDRREYQRKWYATKSPEWRRAKRLRQKPETIAKIKASAKAYRARLTNNQRKLKSQKTTEWQNRAIERRLLIGCKHRAKKFSLPFDLTLDDIIIPEYCPVLGIKLENIRGQGRKHWSNAPSLDKIIPSKGYVKGNVIVVSWRANKLKQDATLEEMQRLAKFYSQFSSATTDN